MVVVVASEEASGSVVLKKGKLLVSVSTQMPCDLKFSSVALNVFVPSRSNFTWGAASLGNWPTRENFNPKRDYL